MRKHHATLSIMEFCFLFSLRENIEKSLSFSKVMTDWIHHFWSRERDFSFFESIQFLINAWKETLRWLAKRTPLNFLSNKVTYSKFLAIGYCNCNYLILWVQLSDIWYCHYFHYLRPRQGELKISPKIKPSSQIRQLSGKVAWMSLERASLE